MTRKIALASFALIAALVGCTASQDDATETATTSTTESLGGNPITIADESTTTDGIVRSELSANDERVSVSFDGATLTVSAPDRTLTLRRDEGVLSIVFDFAARGEHVVSSAPIVERSLDAQMADARGHVSLSSVLRHGTIVPAAAHAIATWAPEDRRAADALLASFVASLPEASKNVATPKMLPGPFQCDQGTGCSIRTSAGYSCSVSCTQGWFSENCATCIAADNGHAYCECAW